MTTRLINPTEFWSPTANQPTTWTDADRRVYVDREIVLERFAGQKVATILATAARNMDNYTLAETKAETEKARIYARSQARKWQSVYEFVAANYSPEEVLA